LTRRAAKHVVFAVSLVLFTAGLAKADVAAGQKAFDEGNYEKAMSEWQSAADKGDPEAEFGLGSLYEQGLGGLSQDYKRAVYWYSKAAVQGNTEALYRLALIWAAGEVNFPPDLIEAYKWAALAAKSKGVWGTAGADLEDQLDKVLSSSEREAGNDRAAKWAAALTKKDEPAAASATPAPTTDTSHTTVKTTGCPGWPFPTLPCTQQFPAMNGR
jgi:TPR repeat protein